MLMILLEQTTTSPNRSSGAKVIVTVSTGPATQILQLEFIQLHNAGGNNVSVLKQNANCSPIKTLRSWRFSHPGFFSLPSFELWFAKYNLAHDELSLNQ